MKEGNKQREVPAIDIITLEELDQRRGGPASDKLRRWELLGSVDGGEG